MDGEATSEQRLDAREPSSGLFLDPLNRICSVFGHQLAKVFTAHQRVEAATGEANLVGRQNLVEAFAHMGTLFAEAHRLTRDDQMEQVSFIADHLRRVMMESFEMEVYISLATIWEDEEKHSVGRLYDARAAPLIRRGKLHGHIAPDELDRRLDEIRDRVITARKAKNADGDFSEWVEASNVLEKAGEEIKALKREVGAAVDAAHDRRSEQRFFVCGMIVSGVLTAAAFGLERIL